MKISTLTSVRFSKLEQDWQEVIEQRELEFEEQLASNSPTLPSKTLARFERDFPQASEQVPLALLLQLLLIFIDEKFLKPSKKAPTLSQVQALDPAIAESIAKVYFSLPSEFRQPLSIGPYKVVDYFDSGGQANLVLAKPEVAGAPLEVVKFANRHTTDGKQIAHEGEVLKELSQYPYPHVMLLNDAGEDDDFAYLALPKLEGNAFAVEKNLTATDIALVGSQIAAALSHVHQHGYLHLDISDRNLFLMKSENSSTFRSILLDFGYAVKYQGLNGPPPKAEPRGGTLRFQAPEQLTEPVEDRKIDERTDVFQLGAVLATAVTGVDTRDFDQFRNTLKRVDLPPILKAGLTKATEFSAADRFQSAEEMQAYFQKAYQQCRYATIRSRVRGVAVILALTFSAVWAWESFQDNGKLEEPATSQIKFNTGEQTATETQTVSTTTEVEEPERKQPQTARSLIGPLGSKYLLIPAAQFEMGASSDDKYADEDEHPQHTVELTQDFYMSESEVTVGQFRNFIEATEHQTRAEKVIDEKKNLPKFLAGLTGKDIKPWNAPGFHQDDDRPVINVSWDDAQAYCEWLQSQGGRLFRLPTEAEWEYACRGKTTGLFNYVNPPEFASEGANLAGTVGSDAFLKTAPVNSFEPNAFGLFDMHGNVAEWCADWYAPDYYENSPPQDPQGPETGTYRVHRGGSFAQEPDNARSSDRNGLRQDGLDEFVGFRVVTDVKTTPPIVGIWKVTQGTSDFWQGEIAIQRDGKIKTASGIRAYHWNGVGTLQIEIPAQMQANPDGDDNTFERWTVKSINVDTIELYQADELVVVLQRDL